jgi:hypothetical protein
VSDSLPTTPSVRSRGAEIVRQRGRQRREWGPAGGRDVRETKWEGRRQSRDRSRVRSRVLYPLPLSTLEVNRSSSSRQEVPPSSVGVQGQDDEGILHVLPNFRMREVSIAPLFSSGRWIFMAGESRPEGVERIQRGFSEAQRSPCDVQTAYTCQITRRDARYTTQAPSIRTLTCWSRKSC